MATDSVLQIAILGPLEIRREKRCCTLPQSRKTRALLAYFSATGRAHSREHLCDLLWEGPADPRAALRWSLSKLRGLLNDDGTARLVTSGEQVGLDLHDIAVDLHTVRDLVGSDTRDAPTEGLEAAAARFRGEFLEGMALSGCHRFDTWLTAERETANSLRDTILAALVERHSDQPERALQFARQRILFSPTCEAAHIDAVRFLRALGRVREALHQVETCWQLMADEAGARPSNELEALRRALLPVKGSARPTRAARAKTTPADLPRLVGRQAERAAIAEAVAGKDGYSSVLLVTGEAGIGKTRLLHEMAATVASAGGRAIFGRAYEAETVRPYGAWIDALGTITGDEIPAPLRLDLAPVLPQLGPVSSNAGDENRLFEAVLGLLCDLARRQAPLAILLDDLQWIDEISAALFHFISREGADSGILLASAARSAELEEYPAAARLFHALSREHRVDRVELSPLNAEETAQLVETKGPGLDAQRVFHDSGGNPLFALEVAHALMGGGGATFESVNVLISDRLARLSPPARNLGQWAAAVGSDFDLAFLSRTTQLPPVDLLRAVEELEQHDVVRTTGSDRYDFRHDLVRRAAYESMSAPSRRLVHRQIAAAFAKPPIEPAQAAQAAHHAALGGDFELAAQACVEAGRHARRVFAFEQAAVFARRGLEHLDHLPFDERLPLHIDILELWVHPSMAPLRPPDFEDSVWRLIDDARSAGLHAQVRNGLQILARHHYHRGDAPRALSSMLSAEEAGRAADAATLRHAIADTARCLGMLGRDIAKAERLAREAEALFAEAGEASLEVQLALGLVHHHSGDLDDAVKHYERALRLSSDDPDPWWEFFCLSRLPMLELERDRPADALARCRALLPVASGMGEGSEAPFTGALTALSRMALGQCCALEALETALNSLRAVDSKWMLAYVQILAAEHDIGAGDDWSGRRRLEEALDAATAVDRRSDATIARAMLVPLCLRTDEAAAAAHHLAALREDLSRPHRLSARARAVAETAVAATPA